MRGKKHWWTAVLTAVIKVLTAAMSYGNVLGWADRSVADLLNQKPSRVNKNIFIIGVDDKTLDEYGSITAWGRGLSAELVDRLNEFPDARPAVIGFDIIYSEEGDEAGDKTFAEACGRAGNVVTVSTAVFKEKPETDENARVTYNPYHVDYMINPYAELAGNVDTGFANTTVDNDGYVRQAMIWADYDGKREYSFASRIYMKYQEALGLDATFPKTYGLGNQFYFSYSGNPGAYTAVSMADVLDGRVDPRIFKDGIVLVGAYAVGMQDSYKPAIMHNGEMYGVEIHANIIQALMEGKTQLPVSGAVYAVLTGLLCGAFFLLTHKDKIRWSTVVLVGMLVGNVIFVKVMYQSRYVIPVLLLPAVFAVIYVGQLVQGYIAERLRRRHVVSVFKQYVAPQVVDVISKDKDFRMVLGGENRHVAVLFIDIRGFTTMSESLEPEQVVEILNEYLDLTTKAVFRQQGTVDKFIGDAVMAVFNAPLELDDYCFRAVSAAWEMKQNADILTAKFEERFGTPIAFGIGVNCGNAVVGNIGCDFRMDYTAIGDTVNTAARLESNAKSGQILISEQVYEAVKDRVTVTPIGEIPLKGKSKGVFVYQVDSLMGKE